MAQARRIKRKPKQQHKARKPSGLRQLPWGLMLVILGSGVVIGLLLSSSQNEQGQFGQGLKILMEPLYRPPTPSVEQTPAPADSPALTQAEFDYYEVLPNIEEVMPSDNDDQPLTTREDQVYYLQAASFKRSRDADSLRAKLALQGLVAETQAQQIRDKGVYYRVRLGPFANRRQAKVAQTKLEAMGLQPLLLRMRNSQ